MNYNQINEIYMYLDSINIYVRDTLNYLKSNNKDKYDIDEIIMYLSTVLEMTKKIEKVIIKYERKKRNELQ